MTLHLKEAKSIQVTSERKSWMKDPQVNKYLVLRKKPYTIPHKDYLTNFEKYYEIFELGKHVGDIKIFYETEEDIFQKRAQIIMVIGKSVIFSLSKSTDIKQGVSKCLLRRERQ